MTVRPVTRVCCCLLLCNLNCDSLGVSGLQVESYRNADLGSLISSPKEAPLGFCRSLFGLARIHPLWLVGFQPGSGILFALQMNADGLEMFYPLFYVFGARFPSAHYVGWALFSTLGLQKRTKRMKQEVFSSRSFRYRERSQTARKHIISPLLEGL